MIGQYEPVIGLEVHVELNTKSKMFCGCSADYFGKQPNTHTCPVCLGLPGALPFINKAAIEKCIMVGLALNCQVQEPSLFERKNYFYPDLPKGYQISQYRFPLCIKGWLEVEVKEGIKKIRINRVHQEEDTGKLMHIEGGSIADFNRSGVPLVEIVTEPDFSSSWQVREFAKKLQKMFRSLGVSNADMERGDMRLEANVSVRDIKNKKSNIKDSELPDYRVELKNINSFKFMADAIEYEIRRQTEVLEKGEKLTQETRGWNESKKETFLQRSKEEANDYRYFPEPDLPRLRIKDQEPSIRGMMPELPDMKVGRYVRDFGVSEAIARVLAGTRERANIFEEAVEASGGEVEAREIANYIVNRKIDLETYDAGCLIEDIFRQRAGMIDDTAQIAQWVDNVINENPSLTEAYIGGKVQVLQALIGQVMKKAGGKVDATKVRKFLVAKLTG